MKARSPVVVKHREAGRKATFLSASIEERSRGEVAIFICDFSTAANSPAACPVFITAVPACRRFSVTNSARNVSISRTNRRPGAVT